MSGHNQYAFQESLHELEFLGFFCLHGETVSCGPSMEYDNGPWLAISSSAQDDKARTMPNVAASHNGSECE